MRLLLSYHYFRRYDLRQITSPLLSTPGSKLFADSGAFSAANAGADVSVDEYAEWLHRWRDALDLYVNLDVIGHPEATLRNQRILEAAGLHPTPVVHGGAAESVLRTYIDAGHRYIALGGMVMKGGGHQRERMTRWIVQMHRIARSHDVKLHGFGNTGLEQARDLPWESVDSSSWMMGGRRGAVQLWDDKTHSFKRAFAGQHKTRGLHELIRVHGVDPDLLARPHAGRSLKGTRGADAYRSEQNALFIAGAAAYLRMEAYLRRRHRNPDYAVYLACVPSILARVAKEGGAFLLNMERNLYDLPTP